MAKILVTGGAGYIGSHIVRCLLDARREVVVVDDLSAGHAAAAGEADLVVGDFADRDVLDGLLGDVDFVIHMAAHCLVGESVEDPARYYDNNVTRTLALLESARRHDVRGIVFSSSAAVYGEPDESPIPEDHPKRPTNPYGETKLVGERAMAWYHRAYGLRSVALRYFNAAGAHPDGSLGERHDPETHLVPILLEAARAGGPPPTIFGTDYPTVDGTCVRDYVHVMDLAAAHVAAVDAMEAARIGHDAFNLGNGAGFSVRQVVDVVRRVTGADLDVHEGPRRAGDPATLVASSERAHRELAWRPAHSDLDSIVRTAWTWHSAHGEN